MISGMLFCCAIKLPCAVEINPSHLLKSNNN